MKNIHTRKVRNQRVRKCDKKIDTYIASAEYEVTFDLDLALKLKRCGYSVVLWNARYKRNVVVYVFKKKCICADDLPF